jgi:hypothetical protein
MLQAFGGIYQTYIPVISRFMVIRYIILMIIFIIMTKLSVFIILEETSSIEFMNLIWSNLLG